MTIEQAAERYVNDISFRQAVDTMRSVIGTMQLTPSEVRDAATYAAYLVELERPPKPLIIRREDWIDPPSGSLHNPQTPHADSDDSE